MVDDDFIRFDFQSDRLLTPEEIASIEKRINQLIYLAADVIVEEMSLKDATKLGAKAFFEDKYWSTVRVVMVKNWQQDAKTVEGGKVEGLKGRNVNEQFLSLELCGGTHVDNTKDIGCFTIISQEAVASWVKRITAFTGPKVSEKIQELQSILDVVVAKLWIKTASQLEDKLDKVMKEHEEMAASLESLVSVLITDIIKHAPVKKDNDFDKIIKIPKNINFKNVLTSAKSLFDNQNIAMYNDEGNFIIFAKKGASAKALSAKLGLKWGGSDQLVQGRDEKVLELFK